MNKEIANLLKRVSMTLATAFLMMLAIAVSSLIQKDWRIGYLIGFAVGAIVAVWAVFIAIYW